MFGITTFMFVLGIIALVLETAFGFQQMQLLLDPTAGNAWSSARTNVIIAVGATITRLMVRPARCFHVICLMGVQYILSDIICAWRAAVLWNRDKRVIAILLFFVLGTTGTRHGPLIVVIPCSPEIYAFQLPPGVTLASASHPSSARPTRVLKTKATQNWESVPLSWLVQRYQLICSLPG